MLPIRKVIPTAAKVAGSRLPSSKRLFANVAVPLNEPLVDLPPGSIADRTQQAAQVTTLNNGLRVASLETYSPTAKVGLFFDAGSRYETPDNLGITHFLRNAAFASTEDRTAFRIAREIEQQGASLEATSTRDHLIFASDCLRDNLGVVVDNLADVTRKPTFKPWELEEIAERVKQEVAIAATQPQIGVLDDIHQVTYRKTLGNSLYCLPHRVGHITTNMLLEFAEKFYTGKRMVLVGTGVEHSRLVELAQNAFSDLPEGSLPQKEAAKFIGGECIKHTNSSLVHAAVVAEGASLGKDSALTLGVLQRILGVTPFIKWGSNNISSRLNKAAGQVTDGPFAVSSLSASYTDSGLFGLYVVAEPATISKVLKSAVNQFGLTAKGDFSDADLLRAKNQFKASVLMACESRESVFEDIGTQVIMKGSYTAPGETIGKVDSITKDDVIAAAKRVFGGKASLAAAGDVSDVPHLDELFKP